jgi:Peptidase family S41
MRPWRFFGALILGCCFLTATGNVWCAQASGVEKEGPDRLVALCKLWAAVKYFHPYLAYRQDIDWDKALVTAIPKVRGAKTANEYAEAVEGMLNALGDPVTRVISKVPERAPRTRREQPSFQFTPDKILMVTISNYADLMDVDTASERMAGLRKVLPEAQGILFDLRAPSYLPETQRYEFSSLFDQIASSLTSFPLMLPSERRRIHFGFYENAVPFPCCSVSGFYTIDGRKVTPAADAKNLPVVFLVNPQSAIPAVALALQAVGRAAIVADAGVSDESLVDTQGIHLTDGIVAQVRFGELVYPDGPGGVEPDLVVSGPLASGKEDGALAEALALVHNFKVAHHKSETHPAQGAFTPDKPYSEMRYPPLEYRLLAAFRIWGVIDYFFPYKDLMGEDWDAVLHESIPKMEHAGNALEYHLAVAEMISHIHDSHGFVLSPVLKERFGAVPPVRVRVIEGMPVITAFGNPSSSTCGDPTFGLGCREPVTADRPAPGIDVGDIILKVDGEDAQERMRRMSKYIAASTPQALLRDAAYFALAGPKDSGIRLTLRGRNGRDKEVELPRNVWNFLNLRLSGSRSGAIYRLLSDDIGYADLTRLDPSMVEAMFDKLKHTRAIIFDMRGYMQFSPVFVYLAKGEPPMDALFQQPVVFFPDAPMEGATSRWMSQAFVQRWATRELRYGGKTVMLIDERAQSASETAGLILEAINGTEFIGSPSAGANGGVATFWVPGGIQIHFSGWSVSHADGRQLQRIGLIPNVEVKPTVEGIRSGKDEVLDKSLAYVQREIDKTAPRK